MKPILLLLLLSVLACDFKTANEKSKPEKQAADGVAKSYYADGKLRAEIQMQNGKKNGRAKEYFKNGKVSMEIDYKDDIKHGQLIRYYETGTLFKEATYVNGKLSGIEKKYRSDGKLIAEMPYNNNNPCMGLKEYLTDGSERKKYPTIIVKPIDTIIKDGKYALEISMSDGSKIVEYHRGDLLDGGCLGNFIGGIFPGKKKGTGLITYTLPSGGFLMDEINIVAKVKTLQGNYYITQRKYNVAIENRF